MIRGLARKPIPLTVLILCLSIVARAQILTGTVVDPQRVPLKAVTIAVPALHRYGVTDTNGQFTFTHIPHGTYAVEFSIIGYRDMTYIVECRDDSTHVGATLSISPFIIPSLTVTASPEPASLESSALPATVIEGRDMEISRGQSIMDAMLDAPGMAGFSRGPGTSKPVIRGLSGERVLVLSDGARQESQSWDDEYSPEIDAFDLDRIEIVRGPGSVLYGSDAIAGVVNVIRSELRTAEEGAPVLAGIVDANLFSNNTQGAGAVSLSGATSGLQYRGHFTYRTAGDYVTPEKTVANSAESEMNFSATAGINPSWGNMTLDFTHVAREQNINVADDPLSTEKDATPFQQIGHDRVRLTAMVPLEAVRLEADVNWQSNVRKEFETRAAGDPDAMQAAVDLALTTISADVKAHHTLFSLLYGTGGISFSTQSNRTTGVKPLIPGFDQTNMAGYLLENVRAGHFDFSAGGRFDVRGLSILALNDSSLHVSAQSLSYNAATWSIGAVWHVLDEVSLALNRGLAWRAPSASELFIHGPDEGVVRYKIGDSTLVPEQSENLDASVRWVTPDFDASISAYDNTITHFIFLSPVGKKDSVTGFDEYQFKQASAEFFGAEFTLNARVLPWLLVNAGADFTHGDNFVTKTPLPLIPAPRARVGLRLIQPALWKINNPYLSFTTRNTFEQSRVIVYETVTGGYVLFSLGCGGEVPIGGSDVHVDFSVDNLMNKSYRDHLSRYKAYELDPGRNFVLRISVPVNVVH